MDEKAIFGAVTLVSGPEALLAERAVRALTQRALLERELEPGRRCAVAPFHIFRHANFKAADSFEIGPAHE